MEIVVNRHVTIISNDHRYTVGFSHVPNVGGNPKPAIEIVVTDKEGKIRDKCPVFKGDSYIMEVAKDGTLGLVMLGATEFICPVYNDKRKCGGCVQYSDCVLAH